MNHKIKCLFVITVFSLLVKQTNAQDTKVLSLQQAIDLSIKNSKHLRISLAKTEEASAVVKEATDRMLPDLNISASYLRLNNANVDMKGSSTNNLNISQALYGIANLSYTLYAGGKIRYGIESARFLEKAAMLDADLDREAVIFNTTKAYTNLYKAFEAVQLVKDNLHSSASRDTNFISLEKNGLLARNDLLKSQLQTSNIELSLMDAEKNYMLAVVNMNLLLGLPENNAIKLDNSFIEEKQEIKAFSDYEQAALQNRKDILATGFRKKASATAIKSAKADTYPSIALTGGYIAADIPHFITITNALNVGVGVKYNLSSLWKTNTKLKQATAREKQVIAAEEMLNDQVRSTINEDYQNYLLSVKKIELFKKSLEQATENFRITNNKYANSLVTLTDLLEADLATLQAKLNIAFAKADAALAYKKLLLTAGLLSN